MIAIAVNGEYQLMMDRCVNGLPCMSNIKPGVKGAILS